MEDNSTQNVRSLMEKITELKDQDVKNKTQDWKKYFDLYKKSYKNFKSKEQNYIKSLNKFDKFSEMMSGMGENNKLKSYINKLEDIFSGTKEIINNNLLSITNCDNYFNEMLTKIKEYLKTEYDDNGLNIPPEFINKKIFKKDQPITSVEVMKDLYDCKIKEFDEQKNSIVQKINSEITKNSETKKEISEKLGVLKMNSIKRNVIQMSPKSPLKILKQLHDALTKNGLQWPTYDKKSLLTMTKKLDVKVDNSMKKVINCKWEKVDSLKQMLDFYGNLEKILKGLDTNSIDRTSGLQKYKKEFEKTNSIDGLIKLSTEVKENVRKLSAKKGNNLAVELYLKALSYREQCRILFGATSSVEQVLKDLNNREIKDVQHYFYYEGVDKAKIFKMVFAVFKVMLSILPVIGQGMAAFAEAMDSLVEEIKNTIDNVIDIKENVEDVKDTIKE